jgi:exodeoxyribonuclease VII small subunit
MSETPDSADIAALPFEKALRELEQIVGQLEQGDVPLERSIEIYERGNRLKAHCEALLRKAELKVDRITLGADGRPTGVQPLDVD